MRDHCNLESVVILTFEGLKYAEYADASKNQFDIGYPQKKR